MSRVDDESSQAVRKNKYDLEMVQITKQEMGDPKEQGEDLKNTLVYRFKQQLINAWRPVPSLSSSIILYLVLTAFFTTIGIVMFIFTNQQYKFETRYDNPCNYSASCNITIQITEDVLPPVYFYYGLTNFNQNQRFFANSKSSAQLEDGQQFGSVDAARGYCGSKTTNGEMGWNLSVTGDPLNSTDVAFPCGLIAYSFFNDTFSMERTNDSFGIFLSQTGIAWSNDKSMYKNYNTSIQGIDVTDQHWLVWLRPAATSSFYKLWGVINSKLQKSTYTITVQNNYRIDFSEKWLKIARTNVFGDKNLVLSIAYLACAGISLLVLMGFIIGKIKAQFK